MCCYYPACLSVEPRPDSASPTETARTDPKINPVALIAACAEKLRRRLAGNPTTVGLLPTPTDVQAASALLAELWEVTRRHGYDPREWEAVADLPGACLALVLSAPDETEPARAD